MLCWFSVKWITTPHFSPGSLGTHSEPVNSRRRHRNILGLTLARETTRGTEWRVHRYKVLEKSEEVNTEPYGSDLVLSHS